MLKTIFKNSPFKKKYIIAFVVVWNVLFIPSLIGIFNQGNQKDFRPNALPPLVFCFVVVLAIILSKKIRIETLKEGKNYRDLKNSVVLVLLILTFLLIVELAA